MESVGKRVVRTPGRYQEDVVPELTRPAFAHPIVPFNPNLPQPAFPTFDEPRSKELQLSKYYWVDGKDIRPPLPSRVMDAAQVDSDAAILAVDQVAPRPALVYRPTPRRVAQENINGLKTAYNLTSNRFTEIDNIGSSEDVSSLEYQIECVQKDPDSNVALEAFKEFPNWSDLSKGIKLVLFDEMMDKLGGSPDATWKMLQLNDNEIAQLVSMHDRETDRMNDEMARIERFQEKSLELILAGERKAADEMYADNTQGGLLQGLKFSPTTIIKEVDIAAAKNFLRHIGIEDRKLHRRISNHRGSQIIPTDKLFKSSKTLSKAENRATDQDMIINSSEVDNEAQNRIVGGRNQLGGGSNQVIVAHNAPPIIDDIAAHFRMMKKLKRKRKRLDVENMPPHFRGNKTQRLLKAQHHKPNQEVVRKGSGRDDFPLIRGPTSLREVMSFEEDESGFSSRIDDSPAAVQPARSAIAPKQLPGRENLWPSIPSKVVRTYGKDRIYPVKLIDNSWNPNPEINGDSTERKPLPLPRSKMTRNVHKMAEKSVIEDTSGGTSIDPNRPRLSLTLFEERFYQHKTKNRSAWTKVTRLLNKEFSLAHTEAEYREKWPEIQRTVNEKLELAKQLVETSENANLVTRTITSADVIRETTRRKEGLMESRRPARPASAESLLVPVKRGQGRRRRAVSSNNDEGREWSDSDSHSRPAVKEFTGGLFMEENAAVIVGRQGTARSSRPRFDQPQLDSQFGGVVARFDTPIPRGPSSASGNRFSGRSPEFESGFPGNPLDASANQFVSGNDAFESGIPGGPFDASDNRVARGHCGFVSAVPGPTFATFDNRFPGTNSRLDSTRPRFEYPDPNESQSSGPFGTGFR